MAAGHKHFPGPDEVDKWPETKLYNDMLQKLLWPDNMRYKLTSFALARSARFIAFFVFFSAFQSCATRYRHFCVHENDQTACQKLAFHDYRRTGNVSDLDPLVKPCVAGDQQACQLGKDRVGAAFESRVSELLADLDRDAKYEREIVDQQNSLEEENRRLIKLKNSALLEELNRRKTECSKVDGITSCLESATFYLDEERELEAEYFSQRACLKGAQNACALLQAFEQNKNRRHQERLHKERLYQERSIASRAESDRQSEANDRRQDMATRAQEKRDEALQQAINVFTGSMNSIAGPKPRSTTTCYRDTRGRDICDTK